MKQLILASASPRRKQLLEQIGLKFIIDPSDIDEIVDAKLSPRKQVELFSQQKAEAVAAKHPDALVLATDSMVALDGKVFGKPKNREHAKEMLRALSGKKHTIITAFTLLDAASGKAISKSVEVSVWFRKIANTEIERYLNRAKPFDKAGAYAIQGLAAVFVEKIEGDYPGAVGLPLFDLAKTLKAFGVEVL